MKGIIDRFEGDYGIVELEGGTIINVPRNLLPDKAKEGDTLVFDESNIEIDRTDTDNRAEKVTKLMDELFE